MNLADIRKKAQRGGGPAESPVLHPDAVEAAAAEPAAAPEPQAEEQAEPALAAAVAAPLDPPTLQWQDDPDEEFLPAEYGRDLPGDFDPAAVILQGRENAALGHEVLQQEETDAATLELLCFKVADEEYAISIMDIKEIIKPREVTEVPRVPSFVRGILSLRGIIIPIFDMRVRLGLPGATSSEKERVIVVNRQTGFCGVLVDEVVQVVRIPRAGIEPPPVVLEGIDRDFVQGIGRVGGRMLILLDMEKVLDVSLL